jgi:hypothetical protein
VADEQRFQADFPEFLDLLENVASYIGDLDLARAGEVPAETLSSLHEGLLRALDFLQELFVLRGEPPPAPEPGVAFRSLGPSLKRTLPQRLAAQLADELNALPGRRPDDVSEFAALGLFARVVDLLRFVTYLQEEQAEAIRKAAPPTILSVRRAGPKAPAPKPAPVPATVEPRPPARAEARPAAPEPGPAPRQVPAPAPRPQAVPKPAPPAPLPPAPAGPGPDLSAYGIRIDEAGERIDAGHATVWFAVDAGPRAAGEGLAASFSVAFPGGVAFAVAEGAESSLGARLSSVVAVRAFCRAAAANPSAPEAAVGTAQHHLDMLLSALLSAGDATDGLTRIRGSIPPANARRILKHTREPEEALRRVTPALATSLVGAVAVASGGLVKVSVVRLGPALVETRLSGRVTSLPPVSRGAQAALLGPGARGAEDVGRTDSPAPLSLSPGDVLLLGTPALAKGATSAWTGLATLWPPFPDGLASGETARELLRRAGRWGETEPLHFAGPLGLAVLLAR